MIKVFEDFDYMRVGQMQSLLESHDIKTFLKNQFGFGGTGELPFVETVPQLYVINDADAPMAQQLLEVETRAAEPREDWTCPECGTQIDGSFTDCWNCAEKDDP
jgi:hypothetical protein